jgi:hypothetical protein
MDPMALEVASEDDDVLLLGEKWCAVLFILLFFTCFFRPLCQIHRVP